MPILHAIEARAVGSHRVWLPLCTSSGTPTSLIQAEFARAIEISVHTLRNWEQSRRKPEGPAIALLRIAARRPRIIRENLRSAA